MVPVVSTAVGVLPIRPPLQPFSPGPREGDTMELAIEKLAGQEQNLSSASSNG
jgi:hypothetical protein